MSTEPTWDVARLVALDGRLEGKLERDGDCILWIGAKSANGYGNVYRGGRNWSAHRWTYSLAKALPADLALDHLCRVRGCVNPDHLEPVTWAENTRRGVSPVAAAMARDECSKGHAYTPENTYRHGGARHCATCRITTAASRRAKGLTPGDPRHGTSNGYQNLGCRCPECRTAHAAATAKRRAAK